MRFPGPRRGIKSRSVTWSPRPPRVEGTTSSVNVGCVLVAVQGGRRCRRRHTIVVQAFRDAVSRIFVSFISRSSARRGGRGNRG